MRVFSADRQYERYIHDVLNLAIAEIKRDKQHRATGRPHTIATHLTLGEPGRTTILVGAEETLAALTTIATPTTTTKG